MSFEKKINVCITTGGTGGHVLPAVCFAEHLTKEPGINRIIFCVDNRGSQLLSLPIGEKDRVEIIVSNSGASSALKRILKAFFFSIKHLFLMRKFDVLVCFGTYNSVSFLISAILFRKKIILHEQNITFSRMNKLFRPFAKYLALSFPMSPAIMESKKNIITGIPVRESFYNIAGQLSPYKDKFTILIVFGSLGGSSLNQWLIQIINLIEKKYWKKIRFLSSTENLISDEQIPKEIEIKNFTKKFDQNMASIYNDCHMTICRGGAVFLYEMLILQKKMLILPLPNSVGQHQKYNGQYVESIGKGKVILDPQIQKEEVAAYIKNEIIKFFKNPEKYNSIENPSVPLDSAKKITDSIFN